MTNTPDPHATPGEGTSHGEGTPQPVAWANEDDDGTYEVGLSEAHAHYVWERAANGKYSHRNPRIVPLYRTPQPALTDEEREAIAWFSIYSDTPGEERHAVVLAKLLQRTN